MRAVAFALLALAGTAYADEAADKQTDQLVMVNATSKLGSIDAIKRVRRVLDSNDMIHHLPAALESVLDGRGVAVADLDTIRETFANMEYKKAEKLIEADETRILQSVASGDPIPALAELSQWRGLIAAAQNDEETAVSWFRAAYRFNPAWSPDKKLASPTVRKLFKLAKHEAAELGKLKVDSDPDDAELRIDGGAPRSVKDKIELPVGIHLVIVSAPKHAPYAELVEINENKTEKIGLTLQKEDKDDRAARLVDATVAAPPGKVRLKTAKPLSRLTGVKRMLYVEDANDDRVVLRIYDLDAKKVSDQIELGSSATSAEIKRKVLAALDTDTMQDPTSVMVVDRSRPTAWYNHWYVWVGAAVVAGAAFGTYEYMSRSPTAVRF